MGKGPSATGWRHSIWESNAPGSHSATSRARRLGVSSQGTRMLYCMDGRMDEWTKGWVGVRPRCTVRDTHLTPPMALPGPCYRHPSMIASSPRQIFPTCSFGPRQIPARRDGRTACSMRRRAGRSSTEFCVTACASRVGAPTPQFGWQRAANWISTAAVCLCKPDSPTAHSTEVNACPLCNNESTLIAPANRS